MANCDHQRKTFGHGLRREIVTVEAKSAHDYETAMLTTATTTGEMNAQDDDALEEPQKHLDI